MFHLLLQLGAAALFIFLAAAADSIFVTTPDTYYTKLLLVITRVTATALCVLINLTAAYVALVSHGSRPKPSVWSRLVTWISFIFWALTSIFLYLAGVTLVLASPKVKALLSDFHLMLRNLAPKEIDLDLTAFQDFYHKYLLLKILPTIPLSVSLVPYLVTSFGCLLKAISPETAIGLAMVSIPPMLTFGRCKSVFTALSSDKFYHTFVFASMVTFSLHLSMHFLRDVYEASDNSFAALHGPLTVHALIVATLSRISAKSKKSDYHGPKVPRLTLPAVQGGDVGVYDGTERGALASPIEEAGSDDEKETSRSSSLQASDLPSEEQSSGVRLPAVERSHDYYVMGPPWRLKKGHTDPSMFINSENQPENQSVTAHTSRVQVVS